LQKDWKFTDIPREATLSIKPLLDCYGVENIRDIISHRGFCAGGGGVGACIGDSGTGLYTKKGTKFFLRGITSSGDTTRFGECDVEKPVIFTNVEKFSTWIEETLDKYF
jgi:secreted trypsin-like serine protease